jgi:uncharacterized protein Yka (UPF0111/DUF47 family)
MEEAFYKEFSDSLKMVFDITSRIDERMKALVEHNSETKERIEKLFDQQSILLNRVIILENKNGIQAIHDLKNDFTALEKQIDDLSERLIHIEKEITQHANKWTTLFDFGFKLAVMIVGGIILWKLGLKP